MGAAGGESPARAALDAYLERVVPQYAENLIVTVNGERVQLKPIAKAISLPPGAGNLPTLRVECDFTGALPYANDSSVTERRLRFEDAIHRDRLGWHEVVVNSSSGISVYNSSAFGSAVTDELKAYPEDMLAAPLDERSAELSFARGTAPAGATPLRTRDGRTAVAAARDPLAELIAAPEVTLDVILLGLLVAAALGAAHAFSPGHGKTVVGAYLVGSRGTPRHALFLGLTVTITHTAGVFALGLVTLFASQYILPERLFPVLSFISGAIVVVIGLSLFAGRLRSALGLAAGHDHAHHHHHGDGEAHTHGGAHDDHTHQGDEHEYHAHVHSHGGGRPHSHLPPGADESPVTWRSLLALGVSGGLLPCPSALVVLLAAISLQRVGYGILLVIAFSAGLAATLTAIGLAFLYAGRFLKLSPSSSANPLIRVLPVASAFVIACVGALICYQALAGVGFELFPTVSAAVGGAETGAHNAEVDLTSMGAMAVLGLGLVFGLKHATEVDHVVAVSTIVSEHRNIFRAALVGGLWGVGHTASLIVVGVVVLALRVAIPERIADWLEFGVALMIIMLGASALARGLRRRQDVHLHPHAHDGMAHSHVHFHEGEAAHDAQHGESLHSHSHHAKRIGVKPLIVGAVHGLAGSAALTLLVLTQISSALLGLVYLVVFGFGSIVGMLLMSSIIGLPFAFGARRFTGFNYGLQTFAGLLSVAFGVYYAYETGIASGLLR
ncbi:MAG: sulfite exporter TauE/SafE family protein [Pyrinomonadaceae bacterium]|nr:sulfite exporter TauE/SafE family protein [Pyrinomonadaceae bacterium]